MEKTELLATLQQRFAADTADKMGKAALQYVTAVVREEDVQQELLAFLQQNPRASVHDAADYLDELLPRMEMELVDDSELDEEP